LKWERSIRIRESGEKGVGGLKISKVLGLTAKDKPGKVISIDDHGLDPIWAKYGEFGISGEFTFQIPLNSKLRWMNSTSTTMNWG